MSNDSVSVSSPVLSAGLKPEQARLGDVISLRVDVRYPQGFVIGPPVISSTVGNFEVRANTRLPAETVGGQKMERFELQLQNFTTGQQTLQPIKFICMDASGAPLPLATPEFKVQIDEVPPGPNDKGDIRGIKGVIGPVAWSPWWWALLGVAVVAAAAWFWRRRAHPKIAEPAGPPVPADEAAMNKLRELAASTMLDDGRIKEFYIGISDILREYLENGFDCPALERTTGELVRDLRRRTRFNAAMIAPLKNLLEDCDLVKFAKFRPDASDALRDHSAAISIVQNTRNAIAGRPPDAPGQQ